MKIKKSNLITCIGLLMILAVFIGNLSDTINIILIILGYSLIIIGCLIISKKEKEKLDNYSLKNKNRNI